jgi:murein DD-endopeptidase MepM/ murein hydrolase activator NlpD
MKNIFAEQHVRRRKKPSFLTKASSSKFAARGEDPRKGYNTDFIRQIKQKPVHVRRVKVKKPVSSGASSIRWPDFGSAQRQKSALRQKFASIPWGSRLAGSAGIPIILTAGIIFFSFLALNGEKLSAALPVTGNFAFEPVEDWEFERNLASYAGLNPISAPAVGEDQEVIPLDMIETFSWSSYTVKRGDSISRIAANHAISMDAVIASNNISNARRLREGETLRIPNMDGIPYTVKKGDTFSKVSKSMGVPLDAILDANDIQSDSVAVGTVLFIPGAKMRAEDLKLALGELFIYPVKGRLSSPYGWRDDPISGVRRYHAALDLAAGMGTPVKASMDGKVSMVGYNATYGNYIIINHNNSYQTMYAHLNVTSVKQGDSVLQGSKIGEVGSTGYSTGPHLHFAIYKSGRAVNPLEFLGTNR